MAYNLIDERWIPVERKSGKVEMIAPAEVADPEDPPLRIASPRPDFDGALLEFLIGLLQTAAAPATERAWEREFETPPTVQALKKRFDTVRSAFFLDGDGPRFMQEVTLTPSDSKLKQIGYLLVDRAGEDNIEDGPSLFTKPGDIPSLSYPAAAAALYLMQSRAPSGGGGGGGHFTSLRGGSALSGVIVGKQLWDTLWLNVLPSDVFGDAEASAGTKTFPWLGAIRSGNKKTGAPTPASAVTPAHSYWALPRRLLLADQNSTSRCAVYPEYEAKNWLSVRTATAGMRYEGLLHPLAAYTRKSESDPWLPFLTPEDGFSYRNWPVLVQSSIRSRPPRVVSHFASTRRVEMVETPRLTAFGYAMESMKPLRWCRAETPLILVAPTLAEKFAADAEALVAVSEEVRRAFTYRVKSAWSDRPDDLDVHKVLGRVNPVFWSRTETEFFAAVEGIKHGLETDDDALRVAVREKWLRALHQAALELFDTFVEITADLAAPDLRRAVLARRSLYQFTFPSSPKLRKLLGLPVEERSEGGSKPRARKPRKESNP
ncbi:type I-E CRISPR-associated protein Cse1/CasA [Anaeromyxobacter oryzisoli]|uniref:type I-E CRISPR-associated protein Cse1/CasA n=1 Tax=Anaeromyxobacter oryzisoli TaxID=2925408 RepID=UPI001F590560|nr:type I-E CRISPR-associated protein Cse1/CasA [Anaeromyxobacter sp. SG63]